VVVEVVQVEMDLVILAVLAEVQQVLTQQQIQEVLVMTLLSVLLKEILEEQQGQLQQEVVVQ